MGAGFVWGYKWLFLYPDIFIYLRKENVKLQNFDLHDAIKSTPKLFLGTAITCLMCWWYMLLTLLMQGVGRYRETLIESYLRYYSDDK